MRLNYGDLGKRFVASFIDGIIVTCMSFLILLIPIVGLFIAPIAGWLYYILLEGGNGHATLGKKIMGLYVADKNGNGITYSTAILRLLGKFLSSLILGIGYLMSLFNDEKQCLHDMLAKTYVLNGTPVKGDGGGKGGTPVLVGANGPLAGMVYPVGADGVLIGRDNLSCQVVIPSAYAAVGKAHCHVTYNTASGMFVLNDRGSTNGTFLENGTRVNYAQSVALKSGDRFYLATPDVMFEVR